MDVYKQRRFNVSPNYKKAMMTIEMKNTTEIRNKPRTIVIVLKMSNTKKYWSLSKQKLYKTVLEFYVYSF